MLGVQAVLAVLINHIVFYMGSVLPFLMVILKKGRDTWNKIFWACLPSIKQCYLGWLAQLRWERLFRLELTPTALMVQCSAHVWWWQSWTTTRRWSTCSYPGPASRWTPRTLKTPQPCTWPATPATWSAWTSCWPSLVFNSTRRTTRAGLRSCER